MKDLGMLCNPPFPFSFSFFPILLLMVHEMDIPKCLLERCIKRWRFFFLLLPFSPQYNEIDTQVSVSPSTLRKLEHLSFPPSLLLSPLRGERQKGAPLVEDECICSLFSPPLPFFPLLSLIFSSFCGFRASDGYRTWLERGWAFRAFCFLLLFSFPFSVSPGTRGTAESLTATRSRARHSGGSFLHFIPCVVS